MRALLRRCFRHHTAAVAYLALFAALGGSAYAAAMITGENIVDGSITSADIGASEVKTANLAPYGVTTDKLGTAAVTGSKVYDESLTGNDVKDSSLTGGDIMNGTLRGWDIADNSVTGQQLDLQVTRAFDITEEDTWSKTAEATCPAGYTVLGGGGRVSSQSERSIELNGSSPTATGQGWRVAASQDQEEGRSYWPTFSLFAYAICAKL